MERDYIGFKHGYDSEIELTVAEDSIEVAVTEEQAMDSYNQDFTCRFYLTREEAEQVRDLLIKALATPPNTQTGNGE